jgi:multisubunit Na+/H+ antiporter MnhC subunit
MAWWGWALVGWVGLSVVVAPLIGMALREADRRERSTLGLGPTPAVAPVRTRRIPVPPLTFALLLTAAALETVGFVVRTSGHEHTARLWSMDAPLSLPRMFVAGLFLAAAVAAAAGAVRAPGRRPWWVAVAVVAALIGEVKAGGTVHSGAISALGLGGRPLLATLLSTAVVAAVLVALWWLSRTERRDRRRMLIAFGLYASAAVGLSGVTSLIGHAGASAYWTAAATFVEETGEAFGAVAVLTAVLVGVAPRLVLPADWLLRRQADALTVDAPGTLAPRRSGLQLPPR